MTFSYLNRYHKCTHKINRLQLYKRWFCQDIKSTINGDIQLNKSQNELPPSIVIKNASKECMHMDFEEINLIQIFEHVIQSLSSSGDDVNCFISGEWVRNKMLGIPSNNMNLTIKGIHAPKFIESVLLYIKKNIHLKIPVEIIDISNTTNLKLKIYGLHVTFSNRKGHYHQKNDSNWFMDAHQKDFTINSLFYNIKEDKIEDYTLRGISDLIQGKISTVVDPEIKLNEHPWIIFNIFKEASSLGFKIDDDIVSIIQKKKYKDSLKDGRSRSMICKSILESFKSMFPMNTLSYYIDYDLYDYVFSLPKKQNDDINEDLIKSISYFSMKTFFNITKQRIFKDLNNPFTEDEVSLLYHTSAIAPIMVERYESDLLHKRIIDYYSKSFIIDSNHMNLAINMIIYSNSIDKIIRKVENDLINNKNYNNRYDINEYTDEFINILKVNYTNDIITIIKCINECIRYWPIIILYRNVYHYNKNDLNYDFNFETNLIIKLKEYGFEKIAMNMDKIISELEYRNINYRDIYDQLILYQLNNQVFNINDILNSLLK